MRAALLIKISLLTQAEVLGLLFAAASLPFRCKCSYVVGGGVLFLCTQLL